MLAANGSIFTILAISFERYYAICKPLKAGYKCTRLRATIIICLVWLLASILTSPILIMAKSSETIYIDGSLVYNCILETDTYWHKMYVFVSMFAFFCLPLLVLMLVYWLIGRRLIRENLAMSHRAAAASSHCPSTATASTDLISTAPTDNHNQSSDHSSHSNWYQAMGFAGASKRIGLRKAASLKSITGFFASFSHYNHDHDHNHHHHLRHSDNHHQQPAHHSNHNQHHHHHHQEQHQQQLYQQHQRSNGQQSRQTRLRAGKAFSLDSHSRSIGKQAINCHASAAATNRTLTIGSRHGQPVSGGGADTNSSRTEANQHRVSQSSCVSPSCCCYYCCSAPSPASSSSSCCCCYRHHDSEVESASLPKLPTSRKRTKSDHKNRLFPSIFNQLQLPLMLFKVPCFWSVKKQTPAHGGPNCSTSIQIGGNQEEELTKKNYSNNDCNNNINNNKNTNLDADQSTRGAADCSASATDINGHSTTPSSSCHSRRTDGITIMNSISESKPVSAAVAEAASEMSGSGGDRRCLDSRSGGIADERLVANDKARCGSSTKRSHPTVAAGHHQLLFSAEYANDDGDRGSSPAGTDEMKEEGGEVDDPSYSCRTLVATTTEAEQALAANGDALGQQSREQLSKLGLKSWLANSLCSYSRASCSRRRFCRAASLVPSRNEFRSSEQDNGLLMADAVDGARSSGPLIAIRPDKLRCQQCQHQHPDNECVDKSASQDDRDYGTEDGEHRGCFTQRLSGTGDSHHERSLKEDERDRRQLQQAKKSAHFGVSAYCTFSAGRQYRNEASQGCTAADGCSSTSSQQQPSGTATNLAHTSARMRPIADGVFDSLDCMNNSPPPTVAVVALGACNDIAMAAAAAPSVRQPYTLVSDGRHRLYAQSSSNCSTTTPESGNSKSPSPDSILQGAVTFRRQHQSDQIMEVPLEDGVGVDIDEDQAAYPMQREQQQLQRAIETTSASSEPPPPPSCSRPSSVAALSGSSASSASWPTNTTATMVASGAISSDRDSMSKSSTSTATAATTTTATTTTLLFVESGKSYQQKRQQEHRECREVSKQMMTRTAMATAPITSVVTITAASAASPRRMSSDQYKINDRTSRANSLGQSTTSSSVAAAAAAMMKGVSVDGTHRVDRKSSHHLAKRFRTRSASKPIVCSQLHNGAHLSELLVVQDLSKKQQMDSRRQVVIMLAFVVACFFLLFFPYRVFTIWLILSTEDQVQSLGMETYYNLTYFSRILIYLHSAINPIAYNLISTKFRRAFMSILLCRGSSTRRHFTTDHQQRLANQLSYHNRKASNSTTLASKDHHHQQPFGASVYQHHHHQHQQALARATGMAVNKR